MATKPQDRVKPDLRELVPTLSHHLQVFTQRKLFETNWDKSQRQDYNLHDLAELYHENTKMRRILDMQTGLSSEIFLKGPVLKASTRIGKEYPGTDRIDLPRENLRLPMKVDEAILSRRSERVYTGKEITLQQLSAFLQYTYGITQRAEFAEPISGQPLVQCFRAAPSGGGLYPNELYLGVLNASGLQPGLYHYNVMRHALEPLNTAPEFVEAFLKAFPIHPEIVKLDQACFVMVMAAQFERSVAKYGPRAYRYVLQECGHIGQNALLTGTALGLGGVAMAGFYDDGLNNLLGLDGVTEAVTYTLAFGFSARRIRPVKVEGLSGLLSKVAQSIGLIERGE
jgi:SagB-type dehydrogenase family enzyme